MNKKAFVSISILNLVLLVINITLICIGFNNKEDASSIFKNNIDSIVEIKASSTDVGESFGSGIIYSSDGYIVTNSHVISYNIHSDEKIFDTIQIRFAKDEEYQDATYIKNDSELDLAIIKINDSTKKYKPINFSNDKYTYGDLVYAIGNTSNYGIGISKGIISVPEVNIVYDDFSRLVIQSDIDISSGNSGGALLDKKGNLIGITTFRTKDLNGNINYGFVYSIPIMLIKEYVM